MKSSASRRELLGWFVAITMTVMALLLWDAGRLNAEEVDPRQPPVDSQNIGGTAMSDSAGPVPDYTFTNPTNWVYLATGSNFPDALGAGPIAGMALGPILLVQQNAIPAETLDELNRLEPEHVIIIGGTAAISNAVLSQVQALAYTTDVRRIAGANRYATAAALSGEFYGTTGYYPRVGANWSDDLPDGTGFEQSLLSIDFETGDGMLIVTAGADFTQGFDALSPPDVIRCWIEVDSVVVTGSVRWASNVYAGDEADCATEAATVVGFGEHTVEYVADFGVNTAVYEGTIWGLYNPFQSQGWRIGP